jgi:hypothetical protein
VIDNPLDTQEATSYKLAAPGHAVGTLTDDAPAGVVGRVGALPQTFPLRVTATDLDSGRVVHQNTQIADETDAGQPTGASSLTQVGPVAVAQAAYGILRGAPVRQSGDMCLRVTLRERKQPLRFCNTYVGGSPAAAGAPMVADFASATSLIDAYNFAALHVTAVDVNLRLRRELRQAFLLDASGPRAVRRGHDIRVKVRAQHVRGSTFTQTLKVHVPSYVETGTRVLALTGTPADAGGPSDGQDLASIFTVTLGDEIDPADEKGPTTIAKLAEAFAATHRDDAVTASFRDLGDSAGDTATSEVTVLRNKDLRLSGAVKLVLRIRR